MNPTKHLQDRHRVARILIADAHADTRALYRDFLTDIRCDVVDAIDGREALVKALTIRPTLVITETRLPVFDGYELCKVLRCDHVTRTVPILIVTADSAASTRATTVGATAVLFKPVSMDALVTEVQRLLERALASHESAADSTPLAKAPRTTQAKAHLRTQTTTPPAPPPWLRCPSCDRPLIYVHSQIGGVNRAQAEQWDAYACSACGAFEYRQRTRKLRRIG